MNKKLNVLHLEDNTIDSELIQNHLSIDGIEYNIVVVKDREGYFKQINEGNYDIILCDYSIPSYSGIEALALAKNTVPDIPFVFCSGTIGEERAVEALKLGATDYILKDNLARLCPAIKRAVDEAKERNERKRAEQELKKTQERFQLMSKAANDAIWDFDSVNKKIWWSEGFSKLFGYEDIEYFSTPGIWAKKIHPDDFNSFLNSYDEAVKAANNYWSTEFRFQKFDGTYAYVFDRGFILYNETGVPIRAIGAMIDISERKKMIENLIDAKEKAEESDKLKSEFLAQMSHEIRTPLNVIMSYASLLKMEFEEKINDELKFTLDGIESAGRRLIRTVELILNMSLIQTGKYEPFFKKVDLKLLLKGLANEFSNLASAKKLDMEYLYEAKNNILFCDEHTVLHIFQNLLDNAIKYTNTGKVKIRVYNNYENKLCIDVEDTGIGISEEYIPNLFEPFTQEFSGYSRRYEGNGLGLALTKKYSDINKANLIVKSQKNVGTTFTIIFNEEELKNIKMN